MRKKIQLRRRRVRECAVSALERRTLLSGAYAAIDLYTMASPQGVGVSPSFAAAQQVVGEVILPGGYQAALWTGPSSPSLLQPATATNSFAYAASGNEQVGMAGGGTIGVNDHAFLWTGTAASAIDLNPTQLSSIESVALAVSGNQQVGYFNPGPGNQETAVLWNGTAASAVSLKPSFGGVVSQARGTDGTHQVGFADDISGHPQAILWSGTAASAVNLAPGASYYESYAMAVSGNEQAGWADGPASTAFLWHGTAASAVNLGADAASLGLTTTQAFWTNGTQEVGWGSGTAPTTRALLWSGTAASITDLQQYLPATFTGSRAYSIDADGNIFGDAQDSSGKYHAVEWTQSPVFVVNTTADESVSNDGTLSLREAIALADAIPGNPGIHPTITFDPTVFTPGTLHTITLGGTQLEISRAMAIEGPGAGVLAVSGNNASGVFQVDPGVNIAAAMSGMTVKGGNNTDGGGISFMGGTLQLTDMKFSGNTAVLDGGAIYNDGGAVTVTNCTFDSNTATGLGGIGGTGGAIGTGVAVTNISDCTFTNNSVSGGGLLGAASGGAIHNQGTLTLKSSTFTSNAITATTNTYGGGAVYSSTDFSVTGCTFTGNSATLNAGGAIYVGTNSHATITDSTFANNHEGTALAGGSAGAIGSAGFLTLSGSTFSGNSGAIGGAVTCVFGGLTAYNCTFYNNSTITSGGALNLGGAEPNTLTNCTIDGNTANNSGGGIFASGTTLNNTIVAGNLLGAGGASDVFGTVSGANNLIGTGGAGGLTNGVQGNIVGVGNPMLGPLSDNGGPTQTMLPLAGSPAIDAGSNALAVDGSKQALTTDQRGSARVVNGTVDIGAVETAIAALSAPNVVSSPVDKSVGAGQTATFTAAATGNPAPMVQWQVSTDGGKTFANIGGATSTALSFTAAQGQDQNRYRAVFTNSQGSATTTAATLTVLYAPTVTGNPSDQSVSSGGMATFTASATGNPAPTVQWQVSTDGGKTFGNIGGATSTTLSFAATAGQNQNQYRAVFTNSQGSATTSAATLGVLFAPGITGNPSNQSVNAGGTASFTAAAGGNPVPTVQWQVSTDGGKTFNDVPGATATTLSFSAAQAMDQNQYRAVFTNSQGSATTTAATLTVTSVSGLTIFGDTTPPRQNVNDPLIPASGGVEVGLKFQSDVVGFVSGIRFFKGNLDTGVHTGELWTSGGTLLATATFNNETASGWQVVTLSHAVLIDPHTTYVVSYHTNAPYIAYTRSGLASAGVDTPPLHVPANSSSDHNGVYKYGASAFPNQYNGQAPNYWVDVVFNPVTPANILGNDAPPLAKQNVNDPKIVQNNGVEVGMKFGSDSAGWIVGIRFFKGALDTGTHSGELWDSSGNLLATATFTSETASGWQTVTFSKPVAISANTVYLVSYHTRAPYIAYSRDGLASPIDNGVLHIFANGDQGNNGVYKYGSVAFPTLYNGQEPNYWVDVLFVPGT